MNYRMHAFIVLTAFCGSLTICSDQQPDPLQNFHDKLYAAKAVDATHAWVSSKIQEVKSELSSGLQGTIQSRAAQRTAQRRINYLHAMKDLNRCVHASLELTLSRVHPDYLSLRAIDPSRLRDHADYSGTDIATKHIETILPNLSQEEQQRLSAEVAACRALFNKQAKKSGISEEEAEVLKKSVKFDSRTV